MPIVSSTGMCCRNAPVLSHFTLNLPMQKASFTFIMPTKFIPCVWQWRFMTIVLKLSAKVMPKTGPSINLDLGSLSIATEQITGQKKLLSKCPAEFGFFSPDALTCRVSVAHPYHFSLAVPSPGAALLEMMDNPNSWGLSRDYDWYSTALATYMVFLVSCGLIWFPLGHFSSRAGTVQDCFFFFFFFNFKN